MWITNEIRIREQIKFSAFFIELGVISENGTVETRGKVTLVEHAWTFYMFFKVASNFYNFLKILRKF